MTKLFYGGSLTYAPDSVGSPRKLKYQSDMPTSDTCPWIYWEVKGRQMSCRRCGAAASFGVTGRGPAYACAFVAFTQVFEERHSMCKREGEKC